MWKLGASLFSIMILSAPGLGAEKVPLPDPLITVSGQAVKTPEQWRARRAEIVELFRANVYGRIPDTPFRTAWQVHSTDPAAMGGTATLKLVRIEVTTEHGSLAFHLNLFVPNKRTAPAPAFLLICNRGPENIDPTRRQKSEFWPAELMIDSGFAAAAFHNAEIDPDQHDGFKDGIHPLLDGRKPRSDDAWATIAAWAWGASRAMDYLVQDADLDGRKIAVVGHSRGGKTSLWAGALDERFALAISNDSGCTGAALARGKNGETVRMINTSFPHWFCTHYKRFNDREDELPLDQHLLVAAMAPRAVYVASASSDSHADPLAEYRSWRLASVVWQLHGETVTVPMEQPPPGKPLHLGRLGYHLREGAHNLTAYDWTQFIAFAKTLFSKSERPGRS